MLTYQERFIPGQRDSLILLQNLLESGLFFDYMMYHQKQEVRIAANALAVISVSLEELSIQSLDKLQLQPIQDPFKQVESAFANLPIENWTAYGYISFDMARFYYPYTKAISQPLLYFFVPETELRITSEGVYLIYLSYKPSVNWKPFQNPILRRQYLNCILRKNNNIFKKLNN